MAPYFLRNVIPRREETVNRKSLLQAIASITWVQWAHFGSGWLAWTCDSLDFFSVSLSVTALTTAFPGKHTVHDVTTAITLTLLFRPVGAIIFGILSDRFGRKWPLVANLILCAALQLGSGFTHTFRQFLAVRSLFGIAMGGVWGLASATALENLPVEVRGIASGIIQEGYAVGYLIAAIINLFLVPKVSVGWRALFFTASGISLFSAAVRAILPESAIFLRAKAIERARGTTTSKKTRVFLHETKVMLKKHWLLCIYSVLLMTGMNFLSHGSQDLYPTYMEVTKGFSVHDATVATIIGNCGAVAGGIIAGWSSQYIGRRVAIIVCMIVIGAFIPLWIIPSSFSGLAAGAFCIQIGVQGAWGVIPVFLNEISPPAFRGTFPGTAYQLGNMVSSASAQIEATGAAHLTTFVKGNRMPVADYAKVQAILIGVVAAFVFVVTIFGPEKHGYHFEKHRTAFEEGGGGDDALLEDEQQSTMSGPVTREIGGRISGDNINDRSSSVDEKGV